MRKHIFLIYFVCIAFAGIAECFAEGFEFGVKPKYWFTELDGSLKISTESTGGTTVDFESDLGMDTSEGVPEIEFWTRFGNNKIILSYFEVEHEGSNVLRRPITYNGQTYTASQRVDSELEIRHAELDYVRTLLQVGESELGVLGGIKYIGFEGTLRGVGGAADGVVQTEDFEAPVPVLGITGNLAVTQWISLFGMFRGITVEIEDVEATLIDIQAGVEVTLTKNFSVKAGYRYLDFDGSQEDDDADYTLQGPMVSALAAF